MKYVNPFSTFIKSDVTPTSYRLTYVKSLKHENTKFLPSIFPLCIQLEQRSKKVQNKNTV
jgi:hypothetical protein